MRHPARLFAAAVITAMMAIAVVALVADLARSHPHRQPVAEPAGTQFALRSIPGLSGAGAANGTPAGNDVAAHPAGAAQSPATGTSSAVPSGAPTGQASSAATHPPAQPTSTAGSASAAAKRGTSAPGTRQVLPTHRQLVAAAVRQGKLPGEVSRSHYLRHLTGGPADAVAMRALGRRDAQQNSGRQQHIVLLDIGGQLRNGVVLSTTPRYITYTALSRAVIAYVQGYHSAQHRDAPVTVAVGTNNDLQTSASTGWLWARQVVQPAHRVARHYQGITVAGATDIEPGFRVGPGGSRAWVSGFLHATKAPLIFNGSADGCSPVQPGSRCAHGWTARDLAWVAGAASPRRISALPQVYNYTMADQWAMISLTALRDGNRALRFHGPLTENAACRGEKNCPTMGSLAAWQALRNSLSLLGPVSLPARTDLDVH
jgi:hypothetical protein